MGKIDGWSDCMKTFRAIKQGYILEVLARVCHTLVTDAERRRQYQGFTGNTQTSYTCAAYVDGKMAYMASSGETLPKPVRKKVRRGKTMYLAYPYEGKARKVTGEADVDGLYGQQTAENFLKRYKAPNKGFALVMTTGTEYSEYIEDVRNLNVLTDTCFDARKILLDNMKPIE